MESSAYKDVYLYDPTNPSASTAKGSENLFSKTVMSDSATAPQYKLWDAVTLINMVATGVIDTNSVETVNFDGDDVETVRFNRSLAGKLESIYTKTNHFFERQSPYATGLFDGGITTRSQGIQCA
jgi:hypothetical protein